MIDKNMLRRYRELNDYSYSMLAKILDVSKREIRDWEVGDSVPDDEQLSILAKLYNISVDDFYFTLKADFVFDVKSIVLLVIALIVGVITGIMLLGSSLSREFAKSRFFSSSKSRSILLSNFCSSSAGFKSI